MRRCDRKPIWKRDTYAKQSLKMRRTIFARRLWNFTEWVRARAGKIQLLCKIPKSTERDRNVRRMPAELIIKQRKTNTRWPLCTRAREHIFKRRRARERMVWAQKLVEFHQHVNHTFACSAIKCTRNKTREPAESRFEESIFQSRGEYPIACCCCWALITNFSDWCF